MSEKRRLNDWEVLQRELENSWKEAKARQLAERPDVEVVNMGQILLAKLDKRRKK